MIRLLLADDHAIVRAGLRALLESEADIEVVGEAGTAEEAIAFCATTPVDLVLMDLRFGPGKTGVDATRAVCALPNPPHVLVVTNYDTDADILSAVEAGASGTYSRTHHRSSCCQPSAPLRAGTAFSPPPSRRSS